MPPKSAESMETEALFKEHAAFVARLLFRFGAPGSCIDDLVQEVFLTVHRQGGYRAGSAAPTTYLAGIATGLLANHRRKERTRTMTLRNLWFARGRETHDTTPAHVLEANDTQRALLRALAALSDEERTVLVMADLETLPCVEVAEALSIPLGTVYWRLHQARARLAREFERVQRAGAPTSRPSSERSR